jgi:hypothetical protein
VLRDGSAIAAQVFRPNEQLQADGTDWQVAEWQAAEKTRFLSMLRRGAQHG